MGYSYKHREYIYRHQYLKKSSALFTWHKHPAPGGGYLDDGTCELGCGRRSWNKAILFWRVTLLTLAGIVL